MTTLEDVLARHPFWNNLSPQYFALLIECAVIEHFGPGEQIFKKGYDVRQRMPFRPARGWHRPFAPCIPNPFITLRAVADGRRFIEVAGIGFEPNRRHGDGRDLDTRIEGSACFNSQGSAAESLTKMLRRDAHTGLVYQLR